MPHNDRRYRFILMLALGCLLLDQVTKLAVEAWLPFQHTWPITPFLDIVHVRNRGAAFGFLNRSDIDWQFWLFLGAVVVACGIIFNMVRKAPFNRMLFTGFALVLGGAVGNLIDRIRIRAVIDFIDVYIGSWHWPAFNVADIAICVGAALIALTIWRDPKRTAS